MLKNGYGAEPSCKNKHIIEVNSDGTVSYTHLDVYKRQAEDLKEVSAERIRVELVKLLVSGHPEYIREACRLGITRVVLPEYDRIVGVAQHTPNHIYDVEEHTLLALKNIEADSVLRLTMLFHDFGKPIVKKTDGGRDIFYKHPEVSAEICRKKMCIRDRIKEG